jgi:hypothetical protein
MEVGEHVSTFAYPATKVVGEPAAETAIYFEPLWYGGRVEKIHLKARDRILLPGRCYQTSIHIHGGSSGGPVLNSKGCVCGINSTSINSMPDVSFVSMVEDLLPLLVPGTAFFDEEDGKVTVRELVKRKFIKIASTAD